MKKFETVNEIVEHLTEMNTRMNAFKAENPDVPFGTYAINNLQPTMLYELREYIGDKCYGDNIEYTNGNLSLWNGGKAFGFAVMFYSVPVSVKAPAIDQVTVLEEVAA